MEASRTVETSWTVEASRTWTVEVSLTTDASQTVEASRTIEVSYTAEAGQIQTIPSYTKKGLKILNSRVLKLKDLYRHMLAYIHRSFGLILKLPIYEKINKNES